MSWLWTFGRVPEIKAAELHALLNRRRPLLIDVRTPAEYKSHIAGAVNASFLPPWSFPSRVQPIVQDRDKETEMYVICLSAHRSIGALKYLKQQGFTNVKQLQGGMQAWRQEGLPEEADTTAT